MNRRQAFASAIFACLASLFKREPPAIANLPENIKIELFATAHEITIEGIRFRPVRACTDYEWNGGKGRIRATVEWVRVD